MGAITRTATLAAILAAATASTPAAAAIVIVEFSGITSTAEGAYVREQDFITGTTVYTQGPVYDDVVHGSFTIDTARLPAADPFLLADGFLHFETSPPAASFASSTFASTGLTPVPAVGSGAVLEYPVTGPDYGHLFANREDGIDTADSSPGANGTVDVRRTIGFDRYTNALFWDGALPTITVDGVVLPDFARIAHGAFGSYHQRQRYVADEVYGADGQILTRDVREWSARTRQSAGAITSISMRVEAAVPEPATWAMMLIGFGMVGAALRRGRGGYRSAMTAG